MTTLEQALQIAWQVKYDWNKPETVSTINPHLETIAELVKPEFLQSINLKDHANLIQLFSQAAAFYLHNSPQKPDDAFKYLEPIKDIFPSIVFSDTEIKDLSGEIQNLLSFYYQQKSFRANNAGKIQEAIDYLQTSDQICEKLFAEYKDIIDSKVAFAYCIQALNSGEMQVIKEKMGEIPNHDEPCKLYEKAFVIYHEILPPNTLDNQFARAKARYAQFLIKAGRIQEAITIFDVVTAYWRKFDYESSPYAHRTFLAFAKSLVELSASNKKHIDIDLKEALSLAEEALKIQQVHFKYSAQQSTEAYTILFSVIRAHFSEITYGLGKFSFEKKLKNVLDLDQAINKLTNQLETITQLATGLAFEMAEAQVMVASLYLDCYAAKMPNSSLDKARIALEQAEKIYNTYFSTHPDRVRLNNKWGYFEYLQGHYDQAEQCFLSSEKLATDLAMPTHHIFETDFGLKVTYTALGSSDLSLMYHDKFVDDRRKLLGQSADSDQELAAYLMKLYGEVKITSNENVVTTQSHITIALHQ